MAWIALIFAGLFEVFGVAMIARFQKNRNLKLFLLMIGGFASSLTLLSNAIETLPMGVAYAIWTGIGTCGSALLGIVLYGESKDWRRILFIAMILGPTMGLKLVS